MKKNCLGMNLILVLLCALFILADQCIAGNDTSSAGPRTGSLPLDASGKMQIRDNDRCPVCAMRPVKYPKFASAISLSNGTAFYFCGTSCMIKSWMHPEHYLQVSRDRLDRPVIHEYFSGKPMDAREVKWVGGSDIVGPMGPALVPVSGEKELEAFQRRHGGKFVFTLDEMDDEKWREVTGKNVLPEN